MRKSDPGQVPDDGGDVRRHSLDERLRDAHHAERLRTGRAERRPKGSNQGQRVLAELIGAPAGGALLGWLADRWLGTSPWCLLALMILGIVVAFRNIIRISGEKPD